MNTLTHYQQNQWFNCDSLKISLKRNYKCGSQSIMDLSKSGWIRNDVAKFEKRLSIVRHPEQRAKSIYKEMLKRNQHKGFDFSGWLQYVSEHGFYDPHQYPQSELLRDSQPIRLFTLEHIESAITWIGVTPNQTPHVNRNDTKVHCSESDKELINHLYKDDFELYELIKSRSNDSGYLMT